MKNSQSFLTGNSDMQMNVMQGFDASLVTEVEDSPCSSGGATRGAPTEAKDKGVAYGAMDGVVTRCILNEVDILRSCSRSP